MNYEPLIAVFKIGRKDHMADLLHHGHVYMNTISYFAKREDQSPRSDRNEGTGYCQNADGGVLKAQRNGEWCTLGTTQGGILFRDDTYDSGNLYCLHGRTERDYGTAFQLDKLGFGESYVLFLDADEFFRRLKRAATREGQKLIYGMVDYVDRATYTGPMGIFRKLSEHLPEWELRVALLPGTGDPLSLWLGDLTDIALMGKTSEYLLLDRNKS